LHVVENLYYSDAFYHFQDAAAQEKEQTVKDAAAADYKAMQERLQSL
jgi:hypothetical protein